MIAEKLFKSVLSGISILCCTGEIHAVNIDPTSYCLTCKEGCTGSVKEQCKQICMNIKEQVASLQMSRLTNETGKKFRTSRDNAEKADMLHDSPLYKCLNIIRGNIKVKKTPAEKNKACLAALQNVEDALNATLNELQEAKKTLLNPPGHTSTPHGSNPTAGSSEVHSHSTTHHETPPSHH